MKNSTLNQHEKEEYKEKIRFNKSMIASDEAGIIIYKQALGGRGESSIIR